MRKILKYSFYGSLAVACLSLALDYLLPDFSGQDQDRDQEQGQDQDKPHEDKDEYQNLLNQLSYYAQFGVTPALFLSPHSGEPLQPLQIFVSVFPKYERFSKSKHLGENYAIYYDQNAKPTFAASSSQRMHFFSSPEHARKHYEEHKEFCFAFQS